MRLRWHVSPLGFVGADTTGGSIPVSAARRTSTASWRRRTTAGRGCCWTACSTTSAATPRVPAGTRRRTGGGPVPNRIYAVFDGYPGLIMLNHDNPAGLRHAVRAVEAALERAQRCRRGSWGTTASPGQAAGSPTNALAPVPVVLLTTGGTPSISYGDEHAFQEIKEDRPAGDDAVRPADPADPAEAGSATLPHQDLIGIRRHP